MECPLAVGANEIAELAVDFRCFLDSTIEHGSPLASALVEGRGSEEITGLEDDFERVTEVMREATDLLRVLDGNPRRFRFFDSHEEQVLCGGLLKQWRLELTSTEPFVTLAIAASPAIQRWT
jgi:hypothetical protein